MPTPNGTHDEPQFDLDDGADFPDDLNTVTGFAKLTGNVKTGTAAQMNALSGAKLWPGLLWVNTEDTDGAVYSYQPTYGWRIVAAPTVTGVITPGPSVSIETRSYLKRRGKQVTMFLALSRTNGIQTGQVLATIPADFRPTTGTTGVMGLLTSGGAPGAVGVYITTDGNVQTNGYVTDVRSLTMFFVISYEI